MQCQFRNSENERCTRRALLDRRYCNKHSNKEETVHAVKNVRQERQRFESWTPPKDVDANLAIPIDSLQLLRTTAFRNTSQSRLVRAFLFWLAGKSDPRTSSYIINGAIDFRLFDDLHKKAVLEVLSWWITDSRDRPVLNILNDLAKYG